MNPSLDVVIPCYNAAATLETAAVSALAQPEVQTVWLGWTMLPPTGRARS